MGGNRNKRKKLCACGIGGGGSQKQNEATEGGGSGIFFIHPQRISNGIALSKDCLIQME